MQSGDPDDQKDGVLDAAEEARMIRIMQYCDGVLSPREAALIADEIARDPEAARLAAEFSASAEAARVAWGSLESGPVPFDLARRVTQAARRPAPRSFVINWRIAASFAVGAVMATLGLLLMQRGDDAGLRLAGVDSMVSEQAWMPALVAALGKDPATVRVTFGGASGTENAISIARWFDTSAGLHCAEFAQTTAGATATGGIACKKPDGGWDVIEQQR